MSSARGLANHSLYMARLLQSVWQSARSAAEAVPRAVDAAFAPAVQLHLLDAYGWFLLAILRTTQLPERPPHATTELPSLDVGIAVPGEIFEYRQLEREGWLARLQATLPTGLPKESGPQVLASAGRYPNVSDYADWTERLGDLFARMSDSLDEY